MSSRVSTVLLSGAVLFTACSEGVVEPVLEPQPSSSIVMASPAQVAAALDAYAAGRGFMASATAPGTFVYDFNDLVYTCALGDTLPNPYHDLVFLTTPYLSDCGGVIVPSHGLFGDMYEVEIELPLSASSVSIELSGFDLPPIESVILTGYDAAGVPLETVSGWTLGVWSTLTLTGGTFARIGITGPSAAVFLDNLTITYVEEPEEPEEPTSKLDCKDGGWEQYGFRNQGQCVRFVETGKDSR